ncbi:MAG: zinc-ribbon domain-containing protein [Methanomassiliicoccales archaeon]
MKCPSCGNEMANDAAFCSKCGASTRTSSSPCRNCGRTPSPGDTFCQKCGANLSMAGPQMGYAPPYQAPGVQCPHCGQSNPWGTLRCSRCGKKMGSGDDYSNIAGILLILTGIINIGAVVLMAAFWGTMMNMGNMAPMAGFMAGMLIFMLVFGVVALIAGWYATQRQHFVFVLVGSVLAAISVGSLFAIIAAILLLISKDSFEN